MNSIFAHPFTQELHRVIARHAMLQHPYYQLWNQGKLDQGILAAYAKQYYAHVRAFPTYVSATHSHCPDLKTRQLLLENLIDEERGHENHPELWLRFAESLGVSRSDVETAAPLPETAASVSTLTRLTGDANFLKGVAALYAYESQIPDVAKTKRQGLQNFYGIADSRAVQFFSVHEEADIVHRQDELSILINHADNAESQQVMLEAAEAGAKALWQFLDGVYQAYVPPHLKSGHSECQSLQ